MALPILYSFRRCPYAMRARLALAESGQPCELREIVLRAKPPELLSASSKGTVPVLVLPGGQVIEQSLDIVRWAFAQHDPAQWLMPEQGSSSDMDALIEQCDGSFKFNLDRYKYPDRYDNIDAIAHRTAGADYLMTLDVQLQSHEYLFGSRPCIADIAIAPFVRQFAHVDITWFEDQRWSALTRWLAAFLASARFQRIMGKYATWEPGTIGARFPSGA